MLIGKGLLHFTSNLSYNLLFAHDELVARIFGAILIVFGLLSIPSFKLLRNGGWIYLYIIPSLIILIQSIAEYIEAELVLEQLVEHSLQIALPLILIYVVKANQLAFEKLYLLLAIFIGLTFVGHAAYALGLHYVPGKFIEMTTKSLMLNEQQAIDFLFIMGLLDILFALLVFVPQVRKIAIWYMIIWGLLTALARSYYVLGLELESDFFLVNLPNTVYRLPHGIIPVLMLVLSRMMDDSGQIEKVSKN